MYFLYFPIEGMCEKKILKSEKKMVQNWLGYCPTVSQYNERLYRDTVVMGVKWAAGKLYCNTLNCIATLVVQWLGFVLQRRRLEG